MVGQNVITTPDFSFPLPLHLREFPQPFHSALGNWASTTGPAYSAKVPEWYIFKTVLKYAPVNLKVKHRKSHTSVAALPAETALYVGGKGSIILCSPSMKKSETFLLCLIVGSSSIPVYSKSRNPFDAWESWWQIWSARPSWSKWKKKVNFSKHLQSSKWWSKKASYYIQ